MRFVFAAYRFYSMEKQFGLFVTRSKYAVSVLDSVIPNFEGL